jgi:hypothetical protein
MNEVFDSALSLTSDKIKIDSNKDGKLLCRKEFIEVIVTLSPIESPDIPFKESL